MPIKFSLGDIIQMRKKHPCGSDQWEIMRTGMDIRLRCQGCSRVVLMPRSKVERGMKGFIHHTEPEPGTES